MDNFKAVYKILSTLEQLKVSQERWNRYIEMMEDVGYVKGVEMKRYITGETDIDITDMRITLKGLEYLQENTIMRKIYNTIKGVKEVTPGL